MTYHAAPSTFPSFSVAPSHRQLGEFPVKDLSYSCGGADLAGHPHDNSALSDTVVKALWASFPEEHTEDGVAEAAAPYFRNKDGEPISKRTIKYWLRGDTLPSALHLSTLVMMQPKMFMAFWFGRVLG